MKSLGALILVVLIAVVLLVSEQRLRAGLTRKGEPPAPLPVVVRRPEAALISAIDRAFQSRFEVLDFKNLGMSRMVVTQDHHFDRFSPQNAADLRLISALDHGGWDAAFFVGGRQAIQLATVKDEFLKRGGRLVPFVEIGSKKETAPRAVSKPILINTADAATPLPSREDLYPRVVEAFRRFAAKESTYEFRHGDWLVITRPIPASQAKCLSCHQSENGNTLKLGDPLGVALYAFAQREDASEQEPSRAMESAPGQQAAAPVQDHTPVWPNPPPPR